ncbi:ribosomal protein S18-alanine N-acetyltransferase [uncultured Pseudacidovorax sp.]|uniref:ribosomal protein S18-alanine N-acetyltransferase n=1 Tax=uncultured Pseudacidovorax sp. TaxID=679313 RepID=UPI0025DEE718|nr:ribosomal protein S18-alanine N-acetyltransferase [uncultured Pseudacidovorax sp.]
MSALPQLPEARLEPMRVAHLDLLLPIEQQAYTHPWTRGNFIDSMHAGYHCQCLMAPAPATLGSGTDATAAQRPADTLIGYYVAMKGVDEVHLLNITVAPAFQRQGWAALMLGALGIWSRGQGAAWLWLEVRLSNTRAQQIYERHGFRRVGQRKGYYPAAPGRREDAIVMSLRLEGTPS